MASVQNCSLLQKDSTDERNGLHARPARRRGKLGAAATGLLPDEAMRARMILVRDSHAAARMLAFPPEPTRIGVSIAVSP
jgi:hypothetical protein